MKSDFSENENYSIFEASLKSDVTQERCDFCRVENILFEEISESSVDGPLSILKLDEIMPEEVVSGLECSLARRIHDHIEYEMPVDECIKDNRDINSQYWHFVEKKVNEKIDNITSLSTIEQFIKTDEMLKMGEWEAVEQKLDDRICLYGHVDSLEAVLMSEDVPLHGSIEKVLDGLEAKLVETDLLPKWEQYLIREEISDSGAMERVEECLSVKIEDYDNANTLSAKSMFTYFAVVYSKFAKFRTVGMALLVSIMMLSGFVVYQDNFKPGEFALYRLQGKGSDGLGIAKPLKGTIQAEKGGSLTFLTKKGYVELQNGSKVEIIKASEKKTQYRAEFADADNQLVGLGSATFFVKHQKKDQHYIVSTHDYRVEVTGTYFRLQPDIGGHVSVAVREGSVRIVFNNGENRILKAGQILSYDLNRNAYYTTNSYGIVVSRDDIEQLPDITGLDNYQRLSIETAPSAGIRIDGRFVGMSPIVIMQPNGFHSITIEKNGFVNADTSMMLGDSPVSLVMALTPVSTNLRSDGNVPLYNKADIVKRKEIGNNSSRPENVPNSSVSGKVAGYDENDFHDAENFEPRNWQNAISLYRKIAENPLVPQVKREAALFSIGKLEAEHESNKTEAKETFLNYLALYPSGNFVGESWLRLAELEFSHDQDKSIEYYLRYFEHYPRHARISELQHRVGLIYLQKKKYDEAIAMLKLSLANYQNDNTVDKGKIQSSLYKAIREKDDSQKILPVDSANTEK
jgi:tetratricopeptide (TPR) repeat protein